MSCRESRRARIDELFHEYETDITKLTQINKRNVEEMEAYKSEILSLEETVKILRSQNESLRQEISKKSPAKFGRYLVEETQHHAKETEKLKAQNQKLQIELTELRELLDKQNNIHHLRENREIFEKDFNQASRDSMFSEMPSPCESLSSRPTSDAWHHGICPDSLYCPEQLNNNGSICYEPDINHGPDIFNHDTLSGYADSTHHFFTDLASGIQSKSPAKSFTTTSGSGTGSAISTPVKQSNNIFHQTPTKTPNRGVIFRTPDKPTPKTSLTSPRRSDRICKIVMNSRDLPKNIKTRILNSRESRVSSIKNGRTYQLSSSRLSSLRAVLEPQTNETPILQSVTRWNSAPIQTEKYSKTCVTPTKNKNEKKDENFQSPRKIQSINILRRKRTQGARSVKSSAETPTRSRRKQII